MVQHVRTDRVSHIVWLVSLTRAAFVFQVKNEWLHNAGAGVIAHVADSLKQQESRPVKTASL